MSELALVYVNQDSPRAASEETSIGWKGSKRGEGCVLDFFTAMALEGRVFQVRLGTITTGLTGDVDVTDTKAEASSDAATGYTIIPVYLNVDVESFAGGTLPMCAAKSQAAVSVSGTVFVALPLMTNGAAAASVCRVSAAGGVVVAAELNTTTRVHYQATAAAVGNFKLANESFRVPPVLLGPANFHLQVAAAAAGPVYFASYDFIELLSVAIS